MSIKISGTGRALPLRELSNDELSQLVDTSDEWIATRTGIRTRRVCTDESLTDLCESAARAALQRASLGPEDIDLLLCSTIEGDDVTPSQACLIQQRLGAVCPAMDINAACAGFLYALEIATLYVDAGRARHVLIVSAEEMSRHVDWTDRSTCVLFGDGAGAAVVSQGTALRYSRLGSNANEQVLMMQARPGSSPFRAAREAGRLTMNGGEVFKFAVSTTLASVQAAADAVGWAVSDFDCFLLHQANRRIIQAIWTRLALPEEKFPLTLHKYGNISSASLPILLDELCEEGRIKPGDRLFLGAFGAGLVTAGCVLVWE